MTQSSVAGTRPAPEVLSQQVQSGSAALVLRLTPDLVYFAGHFPDQPILPGIAQVQMAIDFGRSLLGAGGHFTSIAALKFRRPLRPGDEPELTLEWQSVSGHLRFAYRCAGEAASSGRIEFAP